MNADIQLPASIANLTKPMRYIPVTETAKLISQALKEAFPEIKFSVKCHKYSGGSSININWSEGPNAEQVNAIARVFQGGYFDGMTDYKGHHSHTLNGEPVSFGGDFVFCNRDIPSAKLDKAAEIFGKLEQSQQYSFMVRFGLAKDLACSLITHHQNRDTASLAYAFMRNYADAKFEGRKSKLAASVNLIDSH